MTDIATVATNKVRWVDLSAKDPAAAREFYHSVFGWNVPVNPDPQYGGYAMANIDGKDVAGIGGTMSPEQPTAWSVYIGTDDAEALSARVTEAGGTVVAPPFDVGDQGRMAVFQDPTGAFISTWQPTGMGGFATQGPNMFHWADLSARGLDRAIPFYRQAFGWTTKETGTADRPYTEFQVDGEPVGGASEMSPMVPAEVPSYWLVWFGVPDVDVAHRAVIDGGGSEILPPMDDHSGRMAIVRDPQGAAFGLITAR